jgi:hypothetical protein
MASQQRGGAAAQQPGRHALPGRKDQEVMMAAIRDPLRYRPVP